MLRVAALGLLVPGAAACQAFDSVELGDNPAVRTANLDVDFFICSIQPQVISPQGCAPGVAGDTGCHLTESSYRLIEIDPAYASACDDGVHPDPPDDVLTNFSATEPWIFEDVESSPLLTRPTGVRSHPRQIFATDSTEADLIREWVSVRR